MLVQRMETLTSWSNCRREENLCASTSMTNREPFSTWSLTQSQVRTVRSPTSEQRESWETTINSNNVLVFAGFVVNGQIISKHKVVPGGPVKTYFGRLGISHHKLGLRLEVSTRDISVFHDGKRVKLLWSDAASIKENKWVSLLRKWYLLWLLQSDICDNTRHFVIWLFQVKRSCSLCFIRISFNTLLSTSQTNICVVFCSQLIAWKCAPLPQYGLEPCEELQPDGGAEAFR